MQLAWRHLPHLYVIGSPLFVTFRLHNSLPPQRVFPSRLASGKAFACLDRMLDEERCGAAWLRISAIAQIVIASIQKGAPGDYFLHAWVVMPNHVHLLLTPRIELSVALRRVKGTSAREANRLLGLTGRRFWQEESYDHLVRGQKEFERIERYILQNPVKAGLSREAEEYPWCSSFAGLKPSAG